MTAKQLDAIRDASARWKDAVENEAKTRKAFHDAIVRAHVSKDKHTVTEIHSIAGVSRPTVYNVLIKAGVHTRESRNGQSEEAGGND